MRAFVSMPLSSSSAISAVSLFGPKSFMTTSHEAIGLRNHGTFDEHSYP